MWVTGSAGSGKTAIAQTICERFREKGHCVVESSFFRSTNRTNPKYLFLTIAYQLAVANELLKTFIEAVVQSDPAIVDAALDKQLQWLILDPITQAGNQLPTVFVIFDGLDECEGEAEQIHIIHLIQAIIKDQHLPLRFVVASRPEIWINNAFSLPASPALFTVTLNQNAEANDDIRFFYQYEFTKICKNPEHSHLFGSMLTPWPSNAGLNTLVEQASGQFIYAKTVTRFVGEPGHSPWRRLELVLQSHSESKTSVSVYIFSTSISSHVWPTGNAQVAFWVPCLYSTLTAIIREVKHYRRLRFYWIRALVILISLCEIYTLWCLSPPILPLSERRCPLRSTKRSSTIKDNTLDSIINHLWIFYTTLNMQTNTLLTKKRSLLIYVVVFSGMETGEHNEVE
ncbi:hypothetical protein CPB83DRAFT_857512 [Crepidotus variabilis]|uniref:Nephrocystin 3-like N-terminal domain-containing protein n=1 Tax=Crepidotus variabilis TaxID=179855 RepID=A0A9P6JMY8_9AGAR|nr:hypothetical protein CPB83DRAFT_857512 [Crepidotus variabilis]